MLLVGTASTVETIAGGTADAVVAAELMGLEVTKTVI